MAKLKELLPQKPRGEGKPKGPWWFDYFEARIDGLELRMAANEEEIEELDARVTVLEGQQPVDGRAVIFTAGEPVDEEV